MRDSRVIYVDTGVSAATILSAGITADSGSASADTTLYSADYIGSIGVRADSGVVTADTTDYTADFLGDSRDGGRLVFSSFDDRLIPVSLSSRRVAV